MIIHHGWQYQSWKTLVISKFEKLDHQTWITISKFKLLYSNTWGSQRTQKVCQYNYILKLHMLIAHSARFISYWSWFGALHKFYSRYYWAQRVIEHISYLLVFTEESFKTISENWIIIQIKFMDHKTRAFWREKSMCVKDKFFSKKML